MILDKKIWGGLKQQLSNISLGISGKRFSIVDIPAGSEDLAYTAKGKKIYINPQHEMLEKLDQTETIMFIKGLFAHELMHQLATDFPYFELLLNKLTRFERQIFGTIFNVIEDPSIEYLAPKYFGGHLLRALSYAIMQCYSNSFEFAGMHPFAQFVNALVQYGDGGLLKSEFTSPEAKEYFLKALPIIDKAIEEPNGRKRIELSYEVFELTRPLWDDPSKSQEENEEMLNEMNESMSAAGKGTSGQSDGPMSSGSNSSNNAGGQQTSNKKKERRKLTVYRITEEEAKEMGIDTSQPGSNGNLDDCDTVIIIEGASSNPPGNNSVELPINGPGVTSNATEEPNDDSNKGSEATVQDNSSPQSQHQASHDRIGEKLDSKSEGEGMIAQTEYEISAEDIAVIEASIDECVRLFELSEKEEAEVDSEPIEVPQMDVYYDGVSCNNIRVKVGDEEQLKPLYDECILQMQGSISFAVNQLKRIFRNDIEEKERRASGKINVRRLSEGKMTTHVFDKRRAPSNKSDIAIMFLFDESGSMNGLKSMCARHCAIGMAEVFGKLNIPISIIGFTGDTMEYDVEHYHYISWKNTMSKRLGLLNIRARDCNFDGYSIRYATELLKRRPEQHKLLIIGSDGRPNSDYYSSGAAGIKDTGDAIRQAAKIADVIGVGIGTSDTDVLYALYKNDFLLVSRPEELYCQLVQRIKQKVKKWD